MLGVTSTTVIFVLWHKASEMDGASAVLDAESTRGCCNLLLLLQFMFVPLV